MKRLVLTEGDVELFYWLWMLRVLTISQARRLRYYQPETGRLSSLDNVRKRLARLAKAGYVQGRDILREGSMKLQRVYLLGELALEPLRHRYGIEQRRLYKVTMGSTLQYIHHALMVAEVAVRLVESLRGSTAGMPDLRPLSVPCYHTHAVADARKRRHTQRYVTQENVTVPGQAQPGRIRPDLVFALRKGEGSRLYFLEADRGFESHQQIISKLQAYEAYAATDRWRWYGEGEAFRVLLVTTTGRRVRNLSGTLQEEGLHGLVALTCIEQLCGRNAVFDSIWVTGGQPSPPSSEGRAPLLLRS